MSPTSEPRIRANIEQRLRDALARLIEGKPQNDELAEKGRRGALKISVSAVAKEAACSRTLIGYEGCAYPEVRREVIRRSRADAPLRPKLAETCDRLLDEILHLQRKLGERERSYYVLVKRFPAGSPVPIQPPSRRERQSGAGRGHLPGASRPQQTLKQKVDALREETKRLRTEIATWDTTYACTLLRGRAYDCGRYLDLAPARQATKDERQHSLSIVGRASK